MYLAYWRGQPVVVNTLRHASYLPDIQHGLAMLAKLQTEPHVTQLIGYCRHTYITEFHPFGSLLRIHDILKQPEFSTYSTLATRFRVCRSYVEVLARFHRDRRVMCDSSDLTKTLSQYLLHSDLTIVANDLDALPRVSDEVGVVCGQRELVGDFVAPEQRWPHPDSVFDSWEMRPYDEKTDIWKIPDVCEFLLADAPGSELISYHLFAVHKRCKSEQPELRPSADDVLNEYERIQHELNLQ